MKFLMHTVRVNKEERAFIASELIANKACIYKVDKSVIQYLLLTFLERDC
jgi:hypothetical protein